jgi:hypothetical protein
MNVLERLRASLWWFLWITEFWPWLVYVLCGSLGPCCWGRCHFCFEPLLSSPPSVSSLSKLGQGFFFFFFHASIHFTPSSLDNCVILSPPPPLSPLPYA